MTPEELSPPARVALIERIPTPVSVIMPVLNEQRHLRESVLRVLAQKHDGEVEIVLALGPSKDRSSKIAAELAATDPRIVLVDNPSGRTANALNAAIAASRHPYVVRVDAHGLLPDGYIHDVATLLDVTGAANVGGMMRVVGETNFGKAVAAAMTSRLGIGGSKFHVGGEPGPARTVYLGAFRRDVLVEMGGFDEHFQRAQDWELNMRIRQAGYTVWFTPELAVTYRPRRDFRALRRQFFSSGQWRRQIVDAHPDTASLRYLAAPVVTGVIGLGSLSGLLAVLGLAAGLPGSAWLLTGLVAPLGYACAVLLATSFMGRGLPWRARVLLPGVVSTMHLAWGAGFLRSIPRSKRRS